MLRLTSLASALTLVAASPAAAGTVDFETLPNGEPSDGLLIGDQFLESDGISFSLEGGGLPRLAEVGGVGTAFLGPPSHTAADTPSAGAAAAVGQFFLTDDGSFDDLTSSVLRISYLRPTAAASGGILDLDFDERFDIQLLDAEDQELARIVLAAGDAGTGDGELTPFSFNRPEADVFALRLTGSRSAAGGFGLGFDNFNARAVPSPTAAAAGLSLAVGFLARRRRS